MNIFGAFTFGSLIKTFLPGFVWLIALVIFVLDLGQIQGWDKSVWEFLKTKDQAALVLAIPLAILLGLLSNVVVFMGLNDRWVRTPFKNNEPALCSLYERLSKKLRDQCWAAIASKDASLAGDCDDCIDSEIILIERIGVEKFAYVREQYWYHLEFQLNLLLSLLAIFAALFVSVLINASGWRAFVYAALCLVAGYLVRKWLLKAAKKNYSRHIAKMASLMTALLSAQTQDP
ncbi:hypothetical protein [uncultured Bradyrhizobium sp.]|uniref:hypothetical protein n=1 Tax=uncultured Bradyrhizobium sp. TaxID=199684 RepID=UPI0035CB4C4E